MTMPVRGPCSVLAVGMLSFGITNDAVAQTCAEISAADVQGRAETKIVLLERMIDDTDPVRRVDASGHSGAMRALADARTRAADARGALERGCAADAARLADTGLERASAAFKLVRQPTAVSEDDYRGLLERSRTLLDVLASSPDEERGIDSADMAGIERQIGRAEELAIDGDFSAAAAQLLPVADRLERRIVAIYDRRTILYDLTFAGPEDEFAYLAEQYRGYRLLIDRAAKEGAFSGARLQAYQRFLTDSKASAAEAERLAALEKWTQAVETMQEAVRHSERATRLLGIGF